MLLLLTSQQGQGRAGQGKARQGYDMGTKYVWVLIDGIALDWLHWVLHSGGGGHAFSFG